MNYLSSLLLTDKSYDAKTVLLYRFHLVIILVNILAVIIDTGAQRLGNAWIEAAVTLLLSINAYYLLKYKYLQRASIIFLLIVSSGLFTQIWLNHFGTMSVVFVLLLPLTTMLFIRMRYTLFIELAMITIMGLMLYWEYLYNPSNPIIQNPNALFHLGYAAAIIYLFGLLYHFSIVKTFNELDTSNKQKALLLKEVYHRVKNNLNVIASIIGLQTASLKGEEKEHLLKSKIRIESIAMVHEMLYRSDDLESIDFEAYMKRLSDLLLRMYGAQGRIRIQITSSVESLPLETMVQLGIMVNELITNSIKYAFDEQTDGEIRIILEKQDEIYCFTYGDNGQSIENLEKITEKNSLGIKLIHLTTKQLRGDIQIGNKEGLYYTIRFSL